MVQRRKKRGCKKCNTEYIEPQQAEVLAPSMPSDEKVTIQMRQEVRLSDESGNYWLKLMQTYRVPQNIVSVLEQSQILFTVIE